MAPCCVRLLAILVVVTSVSGCAHHKKVVTTPTFSPEQLRARAGVWGGPEALLAAEAMAYSASRSPWVEKFFDEQHRAPRVLAPVLKTDATEPALAAGFDRDVAQAMTNTGRLEIVDGKNLTPSPSDAELHSTLTREEAWIEGHKALRYRLTMRLLAGHEESPLWQRSQIINKWTTQPVDTQPATP